MKKISFMLLIVLVSLLAVAAVSAADVATDDAADLAAVDEVQAIDSTQIDDVLYDDDENTVDPAGDEDPAVTDEPLAYPVGAGGTFSDLNTEINNAEEGLSLEGNYSSSLFDTLTLPNGISITKDFTINGNNNTIDANGDIRIFNISNGVTLTLNDLILTGGKANYGGAIYNDGNLILNNVRFTENTANKPLLSSGGYGGAIYNTANGFVGGNATFDNNVADNQGGAIYSEGNFEIESGAFTSNAAQGTIFVSGDGGAIYNLGDMVISTATFDENVANGGLTHVGYGGAIYNGGTLSIDASSFSANVAERGIEFAGDGGAIYNTEDGALFVGASTFDKNEAARYGGAIYNLGDLIVDQSAFEENIAHGGILTIARGIGGAIYNGGEAKISESNFTNDTADRGDSLYNNGELAVTRSIVENEEVAIYNDVDAEIKSDDLMVVIFDGIDQATESGIVTLTGFLTDDTDNLIFDRNFAFVVNGDIVPYDSFDEVTGIYSAVYQFTRPGTYEVSADYDDAQITTAKVYYNTTLIHLQALVDAAEEEDEINLLYDYKYFEQFDSALKETGVVVNKTLTIKGRDTAISGSETSRIFSIDEDATLSLYYLVLEDGYSDTMGGAIYAEGELFAEGCTFMSNIAQNPEGSTAVGGAIYANTRAVLNDCTFLNNEADIGGAIFALDGIFYINDGDFEENYATDKGGAIALAGANAYISDTSFIDNQADGAWYNIYSFGEVILEIDNSYFRLIEPTFTTDDEFEYLSVIPINGTFDWGVNNYPINMAFSINTLELFTEVNDGAFNFNLDTQPDVGAYTVVIASFMDEAGNIYAVKTAIDTFYVIKATPTIEVTGATVDYGEPATVTVKVFADDVPVDGRVMVVVDWIVDGLTEVIQLENGAGEATFQLSPYVADGEYTITATYLGNDNFNEVVNDTEKIVVNPSRTILVDIEGGVAEIIITMKDESGLPLNGMINVTFDEHTQEVEVVDGVATVTDTLGGVKEVTVDFLGDENYDPVTVTETVNVTVPYLTPTNITVTANDISYGDKAVIDFTLTDINGNPLDGILNVTVGEELKEVTVTGGAGQLIVEGLNADTYPVVANFAAKDNYLASTGAGHFNVAKNATIIVYEDMNTTAVDYYNDGRVGEYFVWRLVDANGNPMANTRMQIGFNGVIYDYRDGIVTDENGYAKLQINLMAINLYTFAICYLGDQNHNGSFVVAKINVIGQTPALTVPNKSYKANAKAKTLTATFKSNKGTPIANKKVTFTVNGVTYSAKTNDNGVASVNAAITKKGTYTVTVKYDGDSTYNAVSKKATLKIT